MSCSGARAATTGRRPRCLATPRRLACRMRYFPTNRRRGRGESGTLEPSRITPAGSCIGIRPHEGPPGVFAVDEAPAPRLVLRRGSKGKMPMTRNKPPFRADVVGSLLRTAPLKEARAKREKGEITAAQLTAVEDREVEKIIKKQ